MRRRSIVGLALLLGAPFTAGAQQGSTGPAGVTIAPNAEVRVTLAAPQRQRMRGRLLELAPDSLALSRSGATLWIPRATVQRLEVRGDPDRRRGVLWGAGIVGGIAVLFGGADVASGKLGTAQWLWIVATNSALGGLAGAALAPRGWTEVPVSRRP